MTAPPIYYTYTKTLKKIFARTFILCFRCLRYLLAEKSQIYKIKLVYFAALSFFTFVSRVLDRIDRVSDCFFEVLIEKKNRKSEKIRNLTTERTC